MGTNYLQIMYLVRVLEPEYIKNSLQLNNQKTTQLKNGPRLYLNKAENKVKLKEKKKTGKGFE